MVLQGERERDLTELEMASSGLVFLVEYGLEFLGTAEWQPPNQNPLVLPQSPQTSVETCCIRS